MQITNTLDKTKSFTAHNEGYESGFDTDWCRKHYADYEKQNNFVIQGFEENVKKAAMSLHTHIDIELCTGWLVRKTAPHLFALYRLCC